MTLSRGCWPRRFATLAAAEKAGRRGADGTPRECRCGGLLHWHLVTAAKPRRTARRDDIPRAVRLLAAERDAGWCIRCGKPSRQLHHRQLRSQGGRHVPENLITLCGSGTQLCHGYVHSHIRESLDSGWLVSGTADPALIPVMVFSAGGSGTAQWATRDGRWTEVPPIGAVALWR